MSRKKRAFDLLLSLVLLGVLIPVALVLAVLVLVLDGRPVFYRSERLSGPEQGFFLWKFRSMQVDKADFGISGGHKGARITRLGRVLRQLHLDEIPQLWNVIRGDLSFVGPRPPLRSVVEAHPELYRQVLQSRPGLTGMASVFFAGHEAQLLRDCRNAAEAEAVYARRCVPRKARLDMIYQRHQSLTLDLWLIAITAVAVLHLPIGRRAKAGSGRRV